MDETISHRSTLEGVTEMVPLHQHEAEKHQRSHDGSGLKIRSIQEEVAGFTAHISENKKEIEELTKRTVLIDSHLAPLRPRLEQAEARITRISSCQVQQVATHHDLAVQQTALRADVDRLSGRFTGDFLTLTSKMEQMSLTDRNQFDAIQEGVKMNTESISSVETSINNRLLAMEGQINLLSDRNNTLESNVTLLETMAQQLNTKNNQLQVALDKSKSKQVELESQLEKLCTANQTTGQAVHDLDGPMGSMKVKIGERFASIDSSIQTPTPQPILQVNPRHPSHHHAVHRCPLRPCFPCGRSRGSH